VGAGEPLVLLHGLGESHIGWRPVIDALSQEYDVIAVDLPGFGRSPALPAAVSPTAVNLAAAVNRTLDARVTIGQSGGGKTTLMRCVNLLEQPEDGVILTHWLGMRWVLDVGVDDVEPAWLLDERKLRTIATAFGLRLDSDGDVFFMRHADRSSGS